MTVGLVLLVGLLCFFAAVMLAIGTVCLRVLFTAWRTRPQGIEDTLKKVQDAAAFAAQKTQDQLDRVELNYRDVTAQYKREHMRQMKEAARLKAEEDKVPAAAAAGEKAPAEPITDAVTKLNFDNSAGGKEKARLSDMEDLVRSANKNGLNW